MTNVLKKIAASVGLRGFSVRSERQADNRWRATVSLLDSEAHAVADSKQSASADAAALWLRENWRPELPKRMPYNVVFALEFEPQLLQEHRWIWFILLQEPEEAAARFELCASEDEQLVRLCRWIGALHERFTADARLRISVAGASPRVRQLLRPFHIHFL
jgi:hypothetical protein